MSERKPAPPAAPEPPSTRTDPSPGDGPAANGDAEPPAREVGGPKGLEPTRYGDWERNGRCYDF